MYIQFFGLMTVCLFLFEIQHFNLCDICRRHHWATCKHKITGFTKYSSRCDVPFWSRSYNSGIFVRSDLHMLFISTLAWLHDDCCFDICGVLKFPSDQMLLLLENRDLFPKYLVMACSSVLCYNWSCSFSLRHAQLRFSYPIL